jgi:hypothetical protein
VNKIRLGEGGLRKGIKKRKTTTSIMKEKSNFKNAIKLTRKHSNDKEVMHLDFLKYY